MMRYLKNVGQISQVENIVEANGCREEVLADLLVQTDCCLHEKKNPRA